MDFTHEAVRLFIHCRKCGRDMDLTCEFSKSGKELRWGHYGKHLYRKGSKDLIVRNCGDWAKDFYRRVCNLA